MRLHRFYITEKINNNREITLTDTKLIHQLTNVFRFKSGDKVILFDGTGQECEVEIFTINKKEIIFKILKVNLDSALDNSKNLAFVNHVSLYLSLIKKGNFELAVEKVTEIGATEIYPIISERSEKKNLNIDRLNKIVKEASEQSGRVTLPMIFPVSNLEIAVSQVIKEGKLGVVFHTISTDLNSNLTIPKEDVLINQSIALFIGPEGGWTQKEVELFKKNNFQIRSLGQNILRAETAAIIATWEALR